MSFDTMAGKDGLERIIRADVSLDGFATVAHHYADRAGRYDGTNMWSRRIPLSGGLAAVRRALGRDRIAASSTTTLVLENADGGVDWLCGREGIDAAAASRWRIYVGLFSPGASPPAHTDIQWKLLGEFICSEWPRQDNTAVALQLADDFMGRLGAGLYLPTFADWMAVGTSTTNPFTQGIGLPLTLTEDTPIQLAFGEDFALTLPHVIPFPYDGATYDGRIIVPVCATTDLSAVSQDLITELRVEYWRPPENFGDAPSATTFRDVPRNVTGDGTLTGDANVWTVEKSPTITVDGIGFQIVYLVVEPRLGLNGISVQDPSNPAAAAEWYAFASSRGYGGGYPPDAVDGITRASGQPSHDYKTVAARVVGWYVKGRLSSVTGTRLWLDIVHSVDAMVDLVSEYSSATVDATSAARVKAGVPFASCFGVVQPWSEAANKDPSRAPLPLSLRQVLTQLAQSADIDIFVNWNGQIAFASDVYDFTVASGLAALQELRESEVRVQRWVPSSGERGAAFNRVFFDGGRDDHASGREVPFQGPYDIADGDIALTSRVVEVVLQQGWRPYRQQAANPLRWRNLDARVRERVIVTTHRGGLKLELGEYFKLNWTRGSGVGGPYTSAVFQCESITYNPADDSVQLEAVWRDDVQTERSYLLDDETLLVRAKNAAGTIEVLDGDNGVSVTSGLTDFSAMGVAAGDMLVIRDSSEAEAAFTRNRTIRIVSVLGSTSVEVDSTDLNFGGGATLLNADWSIVRGATTYPTALSHPADYPSGGTMYGKATAADGTTSDSETGNRLING